MSLEATEEPSAEVLAAIREAKPELLRLLGDEGKAAQYSRSSNPADLTRKRHPPAAQSQQSIKEADKLRVEAIATQLREIEQQRLTDDWIGEAALVREPHNTCSRRQPDESWPAPSWGGPEQEHAAIAEYDGNIPRVWAEGFARLDPDRPPGDVPLRRWQRFIDDVGRFLDSPFCAVAAALDWSPLDLFGADRDKPFATIDQAGLLWLLNGDRLVMLSEHSATIVTETGRHQYCRKPSGPGRCLAWELVGEQPA